MSLIEEKPVSLQQPPVMSIVFFNGAGVNVKPYQKIMLWKVTGIITFFETQLGNEEVYALRPVNFQLSRTVDNLTFKVNDEIIFNFTSTITDEFPYFLIMPGDTIRIEHDSSNRVNIQAALEPVVFYRRS